MKKWLLILTAVALLSPLSAQKKAELMQQLPTPKTVTFVNWGDTMPVRMDIYYPEHRRPDSTTVLYFFGGGFILGARDSSSSLEAVKALLDEGFVAVSADYRLGLSMVDFDTVKLFSVSKPFFFAIDMAVEDCCHAVKYLCSHSKELGIRTDRIVLTGSSAGAITVVQTDYYRCNNMRQVSALPQGWKPLAVVPYSGAVFCKKGHLQYATPPAPTCFFHGTSDRIVNYNKFRSTGRNVLYGGNQLARRFQENSYPYWILRFKDRGHEVAAYLPYTIQEFTTFVDMVLDGRETFYDATCIDAHLPRWKWADATLFDLYLK